MACALIFVVFGFFNFADVEMASDDQNQLFHWI